MIAAIQVRVPKMYSLWERGLVPELTSMIGAIFAARVALFKGDEAVAAGRALRERVTTHLTSSTRYCSSCERVSDW